MLLLIVLEYTVGSSHILMFVTVKFYCWGSNITVGNNHIKDMLIITVVDSHILLLVIVTDYTWQWSWVCCFLPLL